MTPRRGAPQMGHDVANADARFELVARLADNKYLLGRRYAEWCSSAPALESSVVAAAMAQDELGHARALYPLLKTLRPQSGPEIEPETRTEFLAFSALDAMFTGWPEFIAANLLLDTAITEVFRAASDSSFAPLAGRSRKALLEERAHRQHADGWTRRLARLDGRVRAAFESALNALWDETLMWFGPEGGEDMLSADETLDATPEELRARFLAQVAPILVAEHLNLPVRETKTGWRLTRELPWERWDLATRRITVAPAELSAGGL
jgi:phenylacetate-CoA oxygenase PaaI subunit